MSKISFTDHPESVGESYVEHLGMASSFGFAMLKGGLACLVHGIFPFLCTTTGSRTVRALHERMVTHRVRGQAPAGAAQPQS
jgi:hypothetical protein